MPKTIEEKLITIIGNHRPDDSRGKIGLDDPLEATGIDSLGMAETLFEIEDTFGIVIHDPADAEERLNQFKTVNDLVMAVQELIAQKERDSQSL
jgi:acyl carrier protein